MNWLEFDRWLEAEIESLDPHSLDLPCREPLRGEYERRELEMRPLVDDWIRRRYLDDRCPPLTEDLRLWVFFRLWWAWRWVSPLAHGPHRGHLLAEETWREWLLLDCWAAQGSEELYHLLAAGALASAFSALRRRPG